MKRYLVIVDETSTAPGEVGRFIQRRARFEHATMKAAKRRLGSLIAGKQRHLTRGSCRVYARDHATMRDLSWQDLRNLIEDGAL